PAAGPGDHTPPRRWKQQTRQEWAALGALPVAASLDDEAAPGESPGTDRGTTSSAHCPCEFRHVGRDAMKFGQGARDSECELRTRSEAGVRRQRAVHAQAG